RGRGIRFATERTDSVGPVLQSALASSAPHGLTRHHARLLECRFVVSQVIQHDVYESEGSLGERLIAAIDEAQAADHRLGAEGDGTQFPRSDLLAAIR